ncbi:MAG: hypothetical protein WCO66_04900 [Candidatus Absconditabacteria bacterium]
MDKFISEKKTIIAFVIGIAVVALVWLISVSVKTSTSVPGAPILPPEVQQRMDALKNSASTKPMTGARPVVSIERPMPWTAAATFIERAPIEKIQVSGLDLKMTMKGGAVFATTQPTVDAYVALVKKSTSKIEIVK